MRWYLDLSARGLIRQFAGPAQGLVYCWRFRYFGKYYAELFWFEGVRNPELKAGGANRRGASRPLCSTT